MVNQMPPSVAAFTDTYLPTVNGVTYTVASWRERYEARGGRMDVVFPKAAYAAEEGEHAVRSLPFPFYDGYRLGVPMVPDRVADVDIVHSHSPFTVGMAGYRLARREDLPFVVSFHTPTSEYASYIAPDSLSGVIASISDVYERWFLRRADLVLTPSEATAADLRARVPEAPVEAHPNGVDTNRFEPTDATGLIERYDLPTDRPLIGYTGRHGYEKNLAEILAATAGLDVAVVFGGDGPATSDLKQAAAEYDVDVTFLGFLDREDLPAFYSALDVFAFPSPVETQGLVALEANACGTPVVGVDKGALSETVIPGETGYHYKEGDVDGFQRAIERALDEQDALAETCLARRPEMSLERSIDRLEDAYERVLEG